MNLYLKYLYKIFLLTPLTGVKGVSVRFVAVRYPAKILGMTSLLIDQSHEVPMRVNLATKDGCLGQ